MPASALTDEKIAYEERMNKLFDTYEKVLFCDMQNVRSMQIHNVRIALRGKAELIMGKKTMQKKIIRNRAEKEGASAVSKQFANDTIGAGLLAGNLGMLFTNEDVSEIIAVLDAHRIQAPARIGAIAPCDVVVPAGNTGLEPTMTSFFQALSIPTKISKGTVEITTDKKVLATGEKVDNSTAALLQKLKISPFYYQMEVRALWDRDVLFQKEDLAFTDATIEASFLSSLNTLSAVSLGAGIPTEATFPMMVMDAFKTLLAVSVETEYVFTEHKGEELRQQAKDGKLAGPAGGAAPAAGGAAAAAKVDEPEEEEDDDFGMGGLF